MQSYSLLIVVPTLNSAELLPRLVYSLERQVWRNWRVLFVDGPSDVSHRQWLSSLCASDKRYGWVEQSSNQPGIFGAMNQGFSCARPAEWVLFWGSDDWAATPGVLADVATCIDIAESSGKVPDLLVCRGRYVDASSGSLLRSTCFQPEGVLDSVSYRRALFLGSTPPHQATVFGPGARLRLSSYSSGFRLSADLDYFLQLSSYPGLRIQCLDLDLVLIDNGGVSGQQTQRRLKEVCRAYRRAFGWSWWIPFLIRYFRRVASLFESSR